MRRVPKRRRRCGRETYIRAKPGQILTINYAYFCRFFVFALRTFFIIHDPSDPDSDPSWPDSNSDPEQDDS